MYQQQQQLIQQPWQPQFQQPQFRLAQQAQPRFGKYRSYQGPSQQGFAGYGQPQIQPGYQRPPYAGFVQQQHYQATKCKCPMLVCKDLLLRKFHHILGMLNLT